MLRGMVKSRRESVELYTKGNRPELAAKEEAEIAVIESFLPQQMDEAAMRAGGRRRGRRNRRRRHQGHGQGHGGAEGEARRQPGHGQGRPDGQSAACRPDRHAAMALPASFLDELRTRTPLAGGDRPAGAAGAVRASSGKAAARSTARRRPASTSMTTATTASAAARMATRSPSSCKARACRSWKRSANWPPKPAWRCRNPRRKPPRPNAAASMSSACSKRSRRTTSAASALPEGRAGPRLSARPRPDRGRPSPASAWAGPATAAA